MFFRRQEGEYRETDRVTRFKLIKSGKHWLRASTSQFGLFKVLRGGVDAAQVTTEMIEEQSANTLTGLDILKGIAAAGTVLGGAVATQTTVYANDALEKTVESNQTLANTDTVTLGTVKDQEGAQADSLSVSVSQSQSLSEEASKNASKHLSESESQSVSTSTSASTSASVSASTSASASASTSASESASTSASQSQAGVTSELAKPVASETASNKETSVRKEDAANATAGAALSKVITESLASLQAVETRLSQITSTTSSLVDTTTTAAVATTVSAESNKKAQEDRKRLSKISATMGEYLAKSIGLPNTEAAVAKVNAAVTAIEEALKNPNADLTDVIKQATSAQNSIVNAVLRANNGKRDFLNGKAMKPGTQFRVRNTQTGSGAIGEQTQNLANGETIKYLTSGESSNAKNRVETSVDLKAEPVYAANGKITKIIWTLTSNPRQTMGQTNVRHWIQIPSQVNMPTTIVDASYVDTTTGARQKDMTGLPKSTVPSDNMMPAEYNGMRRDSMEVRAKDNYKRVDSGFLSLNSQDEQYNLLKAQSYHNTGNSDQWRKATWENNIKPAILWTNEERVLWNNINVGDRGRVAVTRFETTVPDNVTNGDLKNMKVMYGEGTHNTTWAGIGIHTNPLKLNNVQAYPFEARGSGTYIVNQVEAPYNTSSFNASGLKWWYENNDTNRAYTDPNQYLVHPGTQNYAGAKGPAGTTIEYRTKANNTKVDAKQIGRTPGVFEYKIHRQFPDNTGADTPVKYVVKPKTPEITTILQDNVSSQTITVENATPNKKVDLYKNGTLLTSATANAQGVATFSNVQMVNQDSFNAKVKIENQASYRDTDGRDKNYVESAFSNTVRARFTDTEKPQIAKIVANKGAKVDDTNPRKIIVYREEAFDVDVKLTDNGGRLEKVKVHDNALNTPPSAKFQTADLVETNKQTAINFTVDQNKLGQNGQATAQNPYNVKITGQVGKAYTNPTGNWTRYISGYDQVGLTNNDGNNAATNNAQVVIEYHAQTEKYTPTTKTQNVEVQANGRVRFDAPETYITNRASLPKTGTTAGAKTTYSWVGAEPTNWTAGTQTRDILVTYPDGSSDTVTVTFNVRDNIAPKVTVQGKTLPTTQPTATAEPIFTVYRGSTFNPIIKAWDNSGKLTKFTATNLPSGVTVGNIGNQTGKTETNKYSGRLINGTVANTQALGTFISEVKVSDGTNETTQYMKYRVVDVVPKNVSSTGEVSKNVGDTLADANQYLATTSEANKIENDKYFSGAGFEWRDNGGSLKTADEILGNPGRYTRVAKAVFPTETKNVDSETRTVFATDKTQTIVFIVKPTKPDIEVFDDGRATVSPITTETTVNQMTITYTPNGSSSAKTLTATKNSGNQWTLNETPNGVTINPTSGQVSFGSTATKANSTITATTRTRDGYSSENSSARLVADTVPPVITADREATVTTGEHVDIPVTIVDAGVGLADKNGVVMTNLPPGLSYENGKITGTPKKAGTYNVQITAKDKRNNTSNHQIRITVQNQNTKYNVTTKNGGTFYAVQGESVDAMDPRDFVNGTIPESANVQWDTAMSPNTAEVGDNKQARLVVTYSDGTKTPLTYNYQVYPKIETKTRNGKTGVFHSFRGKNNLGGLVDNYTNLKESPFPEGMKWKFDYRFNNEGNIQSTSVANNRFSDVWHSNEEHKTDFTFTAVYPNGRFGTVSADNPALTSETQWNYSVYDYVAKQVFETTQGDLSGLGSIVATPKDAVKANDDKTEVPDDSTFTWVTKKAPDEEMVKNPGIYARTVHIDLPADSSTARHSRDVTVYVKVKPKTPVIVENTISEKGGLPDQSIKIDNVVGGATVTLEVGGQTFTKTAGPNDTSVTFRATDLQSLYDANNGLLPEGNISVTQSVRRPDPSNNNAETTLVSDSATGTITSETEAPVAKDTIVEVYDKKTKTWKEVPNTRAANGIVTHKFYAGDKLRFTTKFTDNSGKIRTTAVRQGSNNATIITNILHDTWGTAAQTNISSLTTATETEPATVISNEADVKADLEYSSRNHVSRAIVAGDSVGNRSIGSQFVLEQGKLSDKYSADAPATKFKVADVANLTDDEKARVLADIKAANPQTDKQIKEYTQNDDGSVVIVYDDNTTSNPIKPNVEYGVEKVSDRFYAISDEKLTDLNPRDFVRATGNKDLPANTTVEWKTAPTMDTVGERTATLTVTNPDGTTENIDYNYTVYPKVETKTANGVTGVFQVFRGGNHFGRHTEIYTNLGDSAFPDTKNWSYRYQTDDDSQSHQTTNYRPTLVDIWNNDKPAHTTYLVRATYGVSRFGAVTSSQPELTSEVPFDYNVLEYAAKQDYETTANNFAPLEAIAAKPQEAIQPVNGSPEAIDTTTYRWKEGLDSSIVRNVGYYTRNVRMTILDSGNKPSTRDIPVKIKVTQSTPEITVDQGTNTGGLPEKGITVGNLTPGSTVTLTLGTKTLQKTVGNNATTVRFGPDELADSNGLLPAGDVTVTQTKQVTNPTTGATEDFTASATTTITKETEKPNVEVVLQVKDKNNNWVDQPKKAVRNNAADEKGRSAQGYELYAGDEYRFVVKATDNSGKIRSLEVWDGRTVQTNMTEPTHNEGGTINNPPAGVPITATTTDPATLEITGTYNADQRYDARNVWTRQIRTKDFSENTNNDTVFKVAQGKLNEKFPGQVPATVQVSNATTLSADDKQKIIDAVKGSNPEEANRISGYAFEGNGAVVDGKVRVVITYKDGTSNPVEVPVSDSDRKSEQASRSASESASTSASQSASTSASESARTSASQSASTSASQSASTSASQSASTSASKSASTSASQSASTSASKSASTSASQSASTSASQSASTSASQSASTSASESASTSASQSASTSASESASTSASTSMSVPDSTDKPEFSLSESASQSTSLSVSISTSVSMSTSTSTSLSGAASDSASTSSSLVESNVDHSTSHVGNSAESTAKSRQQLPNTGTETSKSSVLLGALAAVTGLGLFAKRRKRDDEEM